MKTKAEIQAKIEFMANEIGFDEVGFTTLENLKPADEVLKDWTRAGRHGDMKYLENFVERRDAFLKDFADAKTVIVLGVNYYNVSQSLSQDDDRPHGRIARYAWGQDYHDVIAQKHAALIQSLKETFGENVCAKSCVDARPVSERFAAVQAGFGFIGKNTMLLSRKFGPWMFLSEIITNLEIDAEPIKGHVLERVPSDLGTCHSERRSTKPGTGSVEDGNSCGTCTDCQTICPTGALDEDYNIDSRLCIAYLTIEHKGIIPRELRPKIKDWVFGCDECLTGCPFTAHQKETTWSEFKPEAGAGPSFDFDKLFSLTSNRLYNEAFEGTALLRAGRKQMLRNACIVLGNSKSESALPYLKRALAEPSALVRVHAVWGLAQLESEKSRAILSTHAETESDPAVQAELALVRTAKTL